eukprot:4910261-Pyramimonas_sp.AAC.1
MACSTNVWGSLSHTSGSTPTILHISLWVKKRSRYGGPTPRSQRRWPFTNTGVMSNSTWLADQLARQEEND